MFDPIQFLQFLFGGRPAPKQQQTPSGGQAMPVGTIDTSRVGYGVPDVSGESVSPVLQGGYPGNQMMPNIQQQSSMGLQGMHYPQADVLQPANPNRGNDLNSSAPFSMPVDISHLQNIYASVFGKKR